MLTPHHYKIIQLTEDYAALSRDDRVHFEQILWAIQGEARRLPGEFGFHVPVAMVLIGGGYRERAIEHVKGALKGLKTGNMRSFLVLILIGQMAGLGMFEDANRLLIMLLRTDLPDAELTKLHHHALTLALRSGSVELLHRCAQATHGPSDSAQLMLDQLQKHGLLEWLSRQQRALEVVLGPVTTHFTHSVLTDDTGAKRFVLTYHTCAPTPDLRALNLRVFDALHDVYETHPRGPAAFLGHIVIDVRGPLIAETPPTDQETSQIPRNDLAVQTLWRGVRRFAKGRPIDAALRRNWTISRVFQAALHHLMAAAPSAGICLSVLADSGPYDQLISGIVGSLSREWRFRGMCLEQLRCAAILTEYSPGHAATATDVAEIFDLAATILGDHVEAETEDTTACDAPPTTEPLLAAPSAVALAMTDPTRLAAMDPQQIMPMIEAEAERVWAHNPEIVRAMRRVLKLVRAAEGNTSSRKV